MQNLTDERLVTELERGQSAALDELYRRYAPKIYAFCCHAAHNPAPQEIEDLVQDIFLRVIKAAHSFNPAKASFRTWLYRIARNRCIDFTRRQRGVSYIPFIEDPIPTSGHERQSPGPLELIPDPAANTEGAAMEKSLHQAISDCIAQLENEEERQALLLYYFAGKVYREVAEILGRSLSTAKNRVQNAQEKVQHCLEKKGVASW